MSDHETIRMDAIYDLVAEQQEAQEWADKQQDLEAAIIELSSQEDPKSLLEYLKNKGASGEPQYAALMSLVGSLQDRLNKEQQIRQKGGIKSGESRQETAAEKLEGRQEAANPLFQSNTFESKKAVAEEILKHEIADRRSNKDMNGREKAPEIISDDEEHHILNSGRDYLARQQKDPRK